MFHRESLQELEAKLEAIDAEIASHPLASEPVKAAQAIIETNNGKDTEAVSQQLLEQNLPSLEELGKIQVKGTTSWWSLNRARNKLEKKIERIKG